MALKLLVAACLLQVVIGIEIPKLEPEIEQLLRNLTIPGQLENCDRTVCYVPCPGAMPPKRCPADVPSCHSGCACHTDCSIGVITCFETKDCLHTRKFFTARRRATKAKV